MKMMVYQFFIYFFLSTIYGTISATALTNGREGSVGPPPNLVSEVCHLRLLISTMNYTKDCPKLLSNSSDSLPKSNRFRALVDLCTGIVHGVNKICQLQKLQPDPNYDTSIPNEATALEKTINALPNRKNVAEFCNAMDKMIQNFSNVAIIKKDPLDPNVIKLNDLLHEKCNIICDNLDDSVDPLCSALFWINRLLLGIEMQTKTIQKSVILQTNMNSQSPDKSNHMNSQSPDKSNHMNSQSPDKLEPQNKKQLVSSSINDTHSAKSIKQAINQVQGETPQSIKKDSNANNVKSSGPTETPAATQASTAEVSNQKKEQPIGNKADPSPKMPEDIDKKKEENAAEGQPSENDDKGGEQSVLEEPNLPVNEENMRRIKDRITEDNNDKENENIADPDGNLLVEKDDDLEFDSLGAGEAPVINDQSIVARSGPPEPPQHFFAYFMAISLTCLLCYIGYHKKQKIMAIVFEGRKSRGGRGRRRPNTASYRKLDCTLEEAVTSQCNSNVTHVIY